VSFEDSKDERNAKGQRINSLKRKREGQRKEREDIRK
jgi:hypothetical protein